MSLMSEFREFAVKGNMLELAIGVIIGGAFNKIVTSLVNDIIMPPIGLVLGQVDFSNRFLNLSGQHFHSLADAKASGAPTLNYGAFFNSVLDFFLVALTVFIVVKQINRLRRKHDAPPNTKECPYCISVIPLKAIRCAQCTSNLQQTLA